MSYDSVLNTFVFSDSMFTSISGLYAMAVIIMGCVVPVSEIFSHGTANFSFLFDVSLL